MAEKRPSKKPFRAAINFDTSDSDEWYADLPGYPRDNVIHANRTSTPAPTTPARPKSPTPDASSEFSTPEKEKETSYSTAHERESEFDFEDEDAQLPETPNVGRRDGEDDDDGDDQNQEEEANSMYVNVEFSPSNPKPTSEKEVFLVNPDNIRLLRFPHESQLVKRDLTSPEMVKQMAMDFVNHRRYVRAGVEQKAEDLELLYFEDMNDIIKLCGHVIIGYGACLSCRAELYEHYVRFLHLSKRWHRITGQEDAIKDLLKLNIVQDKQIDTMQERIDELEVVVADMKEERIKDGKEPWLTRENPDVPIGLIGERGEEPSEDEVAIMEGIAKLGQLDGAVDTDDSEDSDDEAETKPEDLDEAKIEEKDVKDETEEVKEVKVEDAPTPPKKPRVDHNPRTVLENLAGGLTVRFNRNTSQREPSRGSTSRSPPRSSSAPVQPTMGAAAHKAKRLYREIDDDIQFLEFVTPKKKSSGDRQRQREVNMQKTAKLQQRLTGDPLPDPTLVIRRDHNYQVHHRDGRNVVQDLNINQNRIGLTNNVPQSERAVRERGERGERVIPDEPTRRIHGPNWPRPPTATFRHGNQMIISEGHQPSVFIRYAFGNGNSADIPFAQPPDENQERRIRPQPRGPTPPEVRPLLRNQMGFDLRRRLAETIRYDNNYRNALQMNFPVRANHVRATVPTFNAYLDIFERQMISGEFRDLVPPTLEDGRPNLRRGYVSWVEFRNAEGRSMGFVLLFDHSWRELVRQGAIIFVHSSRDPNVFR